MEYKDFCFVNADAVPLDKLIEDLTALREEAKVAKDYCPSYKNRIEKLFT